MADEQDREAVLDKIIELELAMFLATRNEGGTAPCQQRPDAFRIMRRMTHAAHDDATLASYREDLRLASAQGRNLMVEKYARMDERLPPLSQAPELDEIADAEAAFLVEASARFPHAIQSSGQGIFRRYLRCELETLSERTLGLYAANVRRARAEGVNLAEVRHRALAQLLGQDSLEHYDAALAAAHREG